MSSEELLDQMYPKRSSETMPGPTATRDPVPVWGIMAGSMPCFFGHTSLNYVDEYVTMEDLHRSIMRYNVANRWPGLVTEVIIGRRVAAGMYWCGALTVEEHLAPAKILDDHSIVIANGVTRGTLEEVDRIVPIRISPQMGNSFGTNFTVECYGEEDLRIHKTLRV